MYRFFFLTNDFVLFSKVPVQFQSTPSPLITLDVGSLFVTTCKAVGVPTPEISWRLNWGHVPSKCEMTSVDGFGTLKCPNIQVFGQFSTFFCMFTMNNPGQRVWRILGSRSRCVQLWRHKHTRVGNSSSRHDISGKTNQTESKILPRRNV